MEYSIDKDVPHAQPPAFSDVRPTEEYDVRPIEERDVRPTEDCNLASGIERIRLQQGSSDIRSNGDHLSPPNLEERQSTPVKGEESLAQQLDPALVEALQHPRDKAFILRHEKDMEQKIRDQSIEQWELPLMNTYQRLLVHRMADRFGLGHSIDSTTRQVTIFKQESTILPQDSLECLASSERLSEPASLIPFLNNQPSRATSSSGDSSPSSLGYRIMRRDADGSSRSNSPRQSMGGGSGTSQGRKDRRNMTIEEREAAYREARQRIFGSSSNDTSPSEDVQKDDGPSPPTKTTQFSNNDTAEARQTCEGDEAFGTQPRLCTSSLVSLNEGVHPQKNSQVLHTNLSGWCSPPFDQSGRTFWPTASPMVYPYHPPSEHASGMERSSRSTSISTSTEGGDSVRSTNSDRPVVPTSVPPFPVTSSNIPGSMSTGNMSPGGGFAYSQAAAPMTAQWSQFASSAYPSMDPYNQSGMVPTFGGYVPTTAGMQVMPRMAVSAGGTPVGGYNMGLFPFPTTLPPSSDHPPSYGIQRQRGRGNGGERSLYDPKKSTTAVSSPHNKDGRQALGKSSSESTLPNDVQSKATSHATKGTNGALRTTPPCHPSLPARPDWVLAARAPVVSKEGCSVPLGKAQMQTCPSGQPKKDTI